MEKDKIVGKKGPKPEEKSEFWRNSQPSAVVPGH